MATSIPYQYCTGPVWCWVGNSLLGSTERYPEVDGTQEWEPSYNDVSGSKIPLDLTYEGETKIIILDLNYFDQVVLNTILNKGSDGPLARGALLIQNGLSFPLTLAFSFFGTVNAQAGLPPGEHYFACRVLSSTYAPTGTTVRKTRVVIEAQSVYDFNTGIFQLYSTNPSYF